MAFNPPQVNGSLLDLYALIDDTVKVHPDATDTDKLQGTRHRTLLKTMVGFLLNQAAGGGSFPFDWTRPITGTGTALDGYTNSETTFAAGFEKFLHREVGPSAVLYADNQRRVKGADPEVQLSWSIQKGTANLVTVKLNGVTFQPNATGDTIQQTQPNTDTTYTLYVADAAGRATSVSQSVVYRSPGYVFASAEELYTEPDSTRSTVLSGTMPVALLDSRQMSRALQPLNEKLYVAYPAAMGDPLILVNGLVDSSFKRVAFPFQHTDLNFPDPTGYTEPYVLFCGNNRLQGTYVVEVR